jgi:hypothetical protein
MSDAHRLSAQCPHCGKSFAVRPESVGRRATCRNCQTPFTIAIDPPPLDDLADAPPVFASSGSTPPPPLPPTFRSDDDASSASPAFRVQSLWEGKTILSKVILGVVTLVLFAVVAWLKWDRIERRDAAAHRLGEAIAHRNDPPPDAPSPAPVRQAPPAPAPEAPEPPAPTMSFADRDGHRVGTATVARGNRRTEVDLHLPPGTHANASLPCVFVAPAGSDLISGVAFGEDERDDCLPLLERGIAVCFYSLTGTPPTDRELTDLHRAVFLQQYIRADGGMKNLHDAIDTVLASAAAVDPERLATAGHSSAGTIALVADAREPRIVAAAALAPVIDLPKHVGQAFIDAVDVDTTRFIFRNSPSEHATLNGPAFIYHSPQDDVAPFADAETYAGKHGSRVTLQRGEGDHYDALEHGLEPAFAFLARTLDAKPIAGWKLPADGDGDATARAAGSATGNDPALRVPPRPDSARPASPGANGTPNVGVPPPATGGGGADDTVVRRDPSDDPKPDDRPFTGWETAVGGGHFRTLARPEGFVGRMRMDGIEILRPNPAGIAPRLRVTIFEGTGLPRPTGSPSSNRSAPDGMLQVSVAERKVLLMSPQTTTEVSLFGGTATRGAGDDRDLGRPTQEVLYVAKFAEGLVTLHLVTARGDDEAMKTLEELARSFKMMTAKR